VLCPVQFTEVIAQAFSNCPGLAKNQRGTMAHDELKDFFFDVRP
jgi:hypothetical protein